MSFRTSIIVAAGVSIAVVTSIATASAQSGDSATPLPPRYTAAHAFNFSVLPANRSVEPDDYRSITDTTTRNPGLADPQPIDTGRSVGSVERGVTGAVVPRQDGGLCYELHQDDGIGAGGCIDDFAADGLSGTHGIVGGDFVVMGIVAGDVTSLALEFPGGSELPLSVADGVYTWSRKIDESAPVAIVIMRSGEQHRRAIEMQAPSVSSGASQ